MGSALTAVAGLVLDGGARRATKYLSEKLVVKATIHCRARRGASLVLTVGRPNYAERQFIKACKAAGESFPVKKPQIQWPKKPKR